MAEEVIARRYARTLMTLSEDAEVLEGYYHELRTVVDAFAELPRLKKMIHNPAIQEGEKEALFTKAFKGRLSECLYRFLMILLERRRVRYLEAIIHEFRKEIDWLRGYHPATFTTAITLPDAVQQKVLTTLEKVTGYTLDAEFTVDPSIIGGIHIHIDDVAIDARLSRQLSEIKNRLMQNNLLFTKETVE
jgi:F-type H+-transporting ATPase subunit delta